MTAHRCHAGVSRPVLLVVLAGQACLEVPYYTPDFEASFAGSQWGVDSDLEDGIRFDDHDGDGTKRVDDCDDEDPQSTTLREDADCDGATRSVDCDDENPLITESLDGCTALKLDASLIDVAVGVATLGCVPDRDATHTGECPASERPAYDAVLTMPFRIMRTEVTRDMFAAVTGVMPAADHPTCTGACPVTSVSWQQAMSFADTMSRLMDLEPCGERLYGLAADDGGGAIVHPSRATSADPYTCTGWRLPTEAEWEYAARAGESFKYGSSNDAGVAAAYLATAGAAPRPVCSFVPNALTLCDMSGNAVELVLDGWSTFLSGTVTAPYAAHTGEFRVARGGGWHSTMDGVRVADRQPVALGDAWPWLGFRLVRSDP